MKKYIFILLITITANMTFYAQPHQKETKSPLLRNMVYESYVPYVIKVSSDIGLLKLLEAKPRSVTEIIASLKSKKNVTEALLNVFQASSVINYSNGRYSLSPTANKYLISSSTENEIDWLNKNMAIPSGEMAALKENLLNKVPVAKKENKSMSKWQDKESLIQMKSQLKKATDEVVAFFEALPEFNQSKKLMDYAGSIGYFSMALLDKNQNMKAEVYDLPVVCDIARDIQKNEKNFNRITFHDFDIRNNDAIGTGYDLFFVSNALYNQRTKEALVQFFTQANQSMELGGVIVSNHWMSNPKSEEYLATAIQELLFSYSGRPVHSIEENVLKTVLKETGFDHFTIKIINENATKPRLLIAARKVKALK